MSSVHDFNVYAYEADCEQGRVVLHARLEHVDPVQHVDVCFENVAAHQFEGVCRGNILLGIEERSVAEFCEENPEVSSVLPFKLPADPRLKAFVISPSYGLAGWVIAELMQTNPGNAVTRGIGSATVPEQGA